MESIVFFPQFGVTLTLRYPRAVGPWNGVGQAPSLNMLQPLLFEEPPFGFLGGPLLRWTHVPPWIDGWLVELGLGDAVKHMFTFGCVFFRGYLF